MKSAEFASGACFEQPAHEVGGAEERNAPLASSLETEDSRVVGFSGVDRSGEDQNLRPLDPTAGSDLCDLRAVNAVGAVDLGFADAINDAP